MLRSCHPFTARLLATSHKAAAVWCLCRRVRATIKAKGTNINYSLPTSNVRVTTVKNFWAAAESTNEVNVESMETRIVGVVDGDPGTVVIDDIVGCAGICEI